MKTDFKFSNLLGTVYSKGNLLFTPDGLSLLSPVGNRVSVFDLVNNKSYTLPAAHRKAIARIALNPQGNLLLSVDDEVLEFSPSGRYFAVALERNIEVWHTPSTPDSNDDGELEFAPFVRHRVYTGHFGGIQHIEWSGDSRFFISTSKDLTARMFSLDLEPGFVSTTLAGHKETVQGAWFTKDQETIYTVSSDGALFRWGYVARPAANGAIAPRNDEDEDSMMRWRIVARHYFMQTSAKVTCTAFHASSNLLVVGFSSGIFGLYELPEFNQIHTLSISQKAIDFVTINKSGEWLAFAASKLGQLLVWEWQSESYILKQQGHFDAMNALVYSPDGQRVVTAADDGKVKVWDISSGFCIATFTEHSSGVTDCAFAKKGSVLFTCSLDGSVRAWDLTRYRNFKTFTAPSRLSFSCLAVDQSGEVVCAGSLDSFEIFIWSVQTGQLLDQLSGHEGPVSSLAFGSDGGTLISGSWDRTVRLWSIFGRTQSTESLQLQSDILCVAFRPDSKQLAVSSLDGLLTFWSAAEAKQLAELDARRDASGGRKVTDRRSAANIEGTKHFTTITYSGDGTCLLAAGNTKYICLYDVESAVLLKKFTVSINLSLDGTQEFLNSRYLTEAGPIGLIDDRGDASDPDERRDRTLPGAKRGDLSSRKVRPEVRVTSVSFSPAGRAFCAASTEGLLIYSLDQALQFDPFELDVTVTPANTLAALAEHDYLRALVMAFRLNMPSLIRRVYEGIPAASIRLTTTDMPPVYVGKMLRFVATMTEETPHLEFNLLWIEALLSLHGRWIGEHRADFEEELRIAMRAVTRIRNELTRLADENIYTLDYLLEQRSSSATLQNKSTGGHREADRINVLAQEAFAAGVSLPATTNGQGNSSRKRANKKAKPRPSSDQDELANSNVAAAGGAREVNAAVGDDVSSDTVMPDNNDGGVEEEGPDEDDDTWMGIAD
ncbi:MAG: hypothetical protein M1815_006294 [Lichina confinis]|nr:MAG: hypothetical protein M1815_006294 [Lichina confinis]